jgi:zinc transport system ATP-binding protein
MTTGEHAAGTPGTELLTVRELSVGYPGKPVLGGLRLTIRAGECVALVGANGSGKTTLLRTLLGILAPLAGEIRRGRDGGGLALGYVPQRDEADAVLPLTVAEVVRMGAYRRWRPFLRLASAGRERVAAALAKVRAEGWESRVYAELSGGQRQRVLIARALMAEPDLLLLDEPTAGIDLDSEDAIYAELRRACGAGLGVLMVSHDLGCMVRVATRALAIQDRGLAELPVGELLDPDRMRALLRGGAAHG